MKLNDKLQNQILPILNAQVAETIRNQRAGFSARLLGILEALEEMENNLDDTSPIAVEIALEKMGTDLEEVTKGFVADISTICGHDGALSLVRKIRGESDEEIQMRKEHRTSKLADRRNARMDRVAAKEARVCARAERKAERMEKKADREARAGAGAGASKKAAKKTNRRSK